MNITYEIDQALDRRNPCSQDLLVALGCLLEWNWIERPRNRIDEFQSVVWIPEECRGHSELLNGKLVDVPPDILTRIVEDLCGRFEAHVDGYREIVGILKGIWNHPRVLECLRRHLIDHWEEDQDLAKGIVYVLTFLAVDDDVARALKDILAHSSEQELLEFAKFKLGTVDSRR